MADPLLGLRRLLRSQPTDAERRLWRLLRDRRVGQLSCWQTAAVSTLSGVSLWTSTARWRAWSSNSTGANTTNPSKQNTTPTEHSCSRLAGYESFASRISRCSAPPSSCSARSSMRSAALTPTLSLKGRGGGSRDTPAACCTRTIIFCGNAPTRWIRARSRSRRSVFNPIPDGRPTSNRTPCTRRAPGS